MSYVLNLTIGDDSSPIVVKVIMSFGGVNEEESPTGRLVNAVLNALTDGTEELEKEGIDVQYTVFDGIQK